MTEVRIGADSKSDANLRSSAVQRVEKETVEERVDLPPDVQTTNATEELKEAKRQANFETYERIHRLYEQKLMELCEEYQRQELRVLSDTTRVQHLKKRSRLSYKEALELEELKNSMEKLKTELVYFQRDIYYRTEILEHIKQLQRRCLRNMSPMEENPTAVEFHPKNVVPHTQKDFCERSSSKRRDESERAPVVTSQIQNREMETLTKEREAEKKSQQKHQENADTYYLIFLVQRDKVTQLKQQLKQMTDKQVSKVTRIAKTKENWRHLKISEKFLFKNLKNSLKRLETNICRVQDEITARSDLMVRAHELQQQALRNPNPMEEQCCLADLEQCLRKEWSTNTGCPSTSAAQKQKSERHFSSHSLLKRLHPRSVLSSLQKKFRKKLKKSQSLSAYHGHTQSQTENIQEVIPQRVEHYSSDLDEERASSAQANHCITQHPLSTNVKRCSDRSTEGSHIQVQDDTQSHSESFHATREEVAGPSNCDSRSSACAWSNHETMASQVHENIPSKSDSLRPSRVRVADSNDNSSIAVLETEACQRMPSEQVNQSNERTQNEQLAQERMLVRQTTDDKESNEDHKIKFTIRPKGRAIPAPEEMTEIDRLLEIKSETELEELCAIAMSESSVDELRKGKSASEVAADVDRLLEASDSQLDLLLAESNSKVFETSVPGPSKPTEELTVQKSASEGAADVEGLLKAESDTAYSKVFVSSSLMPGPSKSMKGQRVRKYASEEAAVVNRLQNELKCKVFAASNSMPGLSTLNSLSSISGSSNGSELEVKTTCCDKISYQGLEGPIRITVKPKGIVDLTPFNVVLPPRDLNRLLQAFGETCGNTKSSTASRKFGQWASALCEVTLEVDLTNRPEFFNWFISPGKYAEQQGMLVKRLIQLYRMGRVNYNHVNRGL